MKVQTLKFGKLHTNWDQVGQAAAIALAFAIPISTAATNVLGILVTIAWLLGPNRREKWQLAWQHPLSKWIYAIIALAFIGVFYSTGEPKAIRAGLNDALRLAFIPILIYFYQSKKVGTFALWAFSAAMVLTLILAYLKVYAGLPIGLKYTTGAIFKSHIKTSYFMGIAAFFLALKAKELPHFRKPFIILILLMMYYLLFMSVGRIGYLTLVVCLWVIAWQWYRIKGLVGATLIALVLLLAAFFTSDVFHQRMTLLNQDLELYHQDGDLLKSSLGSRLTFALSSVELIHARPWIGYGTGSFGAAYEKHYEGRQTLLTDNPHNEYLRMGVEFGLLGIGAMLLLFGSQWRSSRLLSSDRRDLWQGIMLTFIVGCFINSWLKDFTECFFFCVMTAICFAQLRKH